MLEQLIQHDYTGNFRELEYLLRLAISTSEDQFIEATPSVLQEIRRAEIDPPAATNLDRDKLKAALAEHRGSASEVAHALGLSSRFALYRLLKKFDLSFEDDERE